MRPTTAHRLRNLAHAALLLGGMAALAWGVTAALFGPAAGLWGLVGVGAALALAPAAPKRMILAAYGARPVDPRVFPWAAEVLAELAHRAALPRAPALWYVPSALPNAFAVGTPGDSAVAVSDGMLRLLDARELAGVLAHEVAHVANRDLWLMAFADLTTRLVSIVSMAGQLLLLLNLPLIAFGAVHVPWLALALMILAPSVASLLQLALSRAREFDADLGGATLTGDPQGLARALAKLERRVGRVWEEILLPGRRVPEPSLLRTHPPTEERVARLMALAPPERARPLPRAAFGPPPFAVAAGPPRWRRAGVWW